MSRRGNPKFIRVALVLPTEYAYARSTLKGIIAATRERNMYTGSERGARAEKPWLFNVFRGIYGHSTKFLSKWFNEWNPDGIIGQIYDDRLVKVYRTTGKPVVELFESRGRSEFTRILLDDVELGRWAARHFLQRGFRHFGFFGVSWMKWSQERGQGFLTEIQAELAGAVPAAGPGDRRGAFTFSAFSGHQLNGKAHHPGGNGMAQWLSKLPKPVAVFAANDLWGSELIQAARSAALHVPDEVAVLGADNDELLCEMSYPPLSSIRLGAEQVGRVAVDTLDRLMRGVPIPVDLPRIAPVELVTRQSTDTLAVQDPDVSAALRHIRLHAIDGISVKQLMSELAVNRRTLERRFSQIVGHTPLEEIRRVRLEQAKVLLQTTMPIHEVATRSGFATPEYLATSFRQSTGVSPTEYRRQFGPRNRWEDLPAASAR